MYNNERYASIMDTGKAEQLLFNSGEEGLDMKKVVGSGGFNLEKEIEN